MSPDRWLVYRAKALLDQPPEQDAQAVEDASAVEKLRTALVERDDALRRAREDLAGARFIAAAWEAGSSPLVPNFNKIARPSRGRGPGGVRPRRGPRKPTD
jgi:hypothetical protein